jgi:hypothetical protein
MDDVKVITKHASEIAVVLSNLQQAQHRVVGAKVPSHFLYCFF